MENGLLTTRPWSHNLCDVCYANKDGCKCFPYLIPMSVCSPCMIVGRIESLLEREKLHCCEMGDKGWICCLLSAPIASFGPFGGFLYFYCLSNRWRDTIVKRYTVQEEKAPCCFEYCPGFWFGMHYPCSFFQMYNSLSEWHHEGKLTFNNILYFLDVRLPLKTTILLTYLYHVKNWLQSNKQTSK